MPEFLLASWPLGTSTVLFLDGVSSYIEENDHVLMFRSSGQMVGKSSVIDEELGQTLKDHILFRVPLSIHNCLSKDRPTYSHKSRSWTRLDTTHFWNTCTILLKITNEWIICFRLHSFAEPEHPAPDRGLEVRSHVITAQVIECEPSASSSQYLASAAIISQFGS
jgi:hypothetical protein